MERHPFDPFSAVFGLLFVGIGVTFMSGELDLVDVDGRVAAAVLLLFVSLMIAALALRRARTEDGPLSPGSEPIESPSTRPPPQP